MISRLAPMAKVIFRNSPQIKTSLLSKQTNSINININNNHIIINAFSNNFKNDKFKLKSFFTNSYFYEKTPNKAIFLQLVRSFKRTVQIKNNQIPKEETVSIFKRYIYSSIKEACLN